MNEVEKTPEDATRYGPGAEESATTAQAPATYRVSTWDHEQEEWHLREPGATKWQLRVWLRRLYAESWDCVSILIESNS